MGGHLGVLFGLLGQLRVRGMTKPQHTEAARLRIVLLNGRRRGRLAGPGSSRIELGRARAIARLNATVGSELFGGLSARSLLAALEDTGRVEGAAALEVLFAPPRA